MPATVMNKLLLLKTLKKLVKLRNCNVGQFSASKSQELKFVFLKGMWILEVFIDVWSCKYYSKNFNKVL